MKSLQGVEKCAYCYSFFKLKIISIPFAEKQINNMYNISEKELDNNSNSKYRL